jgi:4-aminobutyrate aminotransferase-like enzyme
MVHDNDVGAESCFARIHHKTFVEVRALAAQTIFTRRRHIAPDRGCLRDVGQLATGVVHTSTLYLIRRQIELAEKLARLSGIEGAKVFFTNSGTEANETALMLATAARGSNQVLAMRNSYHGRSFGAVAITGNLAWKSSPLAPFGVHYLHGTDRELPGFAGMSDDEYIAACAADLRHLLTAGANREVACLIAEPVQGVGGFTMPPDGLFGEYKKVLDSRGILFISDEVQTGWGRTGDHFWGYSSAGSPSGVDVAWALT